MSKFDTQSWIEAGRSYQRLRRPSWRFSVGHIGSAIVTGMLFFAASAKGVIPVVAPILFFVLIFTTMALALGGLATSTSLMDFTCPRCERRFDSWWKTWPTGRCQHRGLVLRPVAIAGKKAPSLKERPDWPSLDD